MIVTAAQRKVIHDILNRMVLGVNGYPGIIFLYEGNRELGISEKDGRFLRAVMQSEGLVTNSDGDRQNNLSTLTAKGESIARSPGGYWGYVQQEIAQHEQQRQREDEQFDLNRRGVTATVDSAKSAKDSAKSAKASTWIAALSLVVAIVAAYIAFQANAGSTDVNTRIQKLEAQLNQLQRRPATTEYRKLPNHTSPKEGNVGGAVPPNGL